MLTDFDGEEITDEEFEIIFDNLKKMTKEKIDELFFRCGWIEVDRDDNMAVSDYRIEEIRNGTKLGRDFVSTFLQETYKKDWKVLIRFKK